MPPPGGGQWLGHALVTFTGSSVQAYLNIAKNGQSVSGALIALATPPPRPATSLTQEEAVAAARAAAPQSADRPVISAEAGPSGELLTPESLFSEFSSGIPSGRWVWVINLASGPALGAAGSVVVIDFLDGRVYGVINWIS